jgi:hypothetical protein
MQTIVKTTKPQDLLALVPHLVGFRPSNSLVLVAFRGKRTGGAYRVDLPAPASGLVYKRIATTLIGMLCRIEGADGVVPVIYTDDRFDECGGIPRETLARRLISRARSAGFDVKEALCVAQDGWGSYYDDEGAGQQPLEMIDESAAHTALAGTDEPPLTTPDERAKLPASTLLRQEAVARQIERLKAEFAQCVATDSDPVGEIGIGGDPAMVLDGWTNPVGVAEMAIGWQSDRLDPACTALIVLAAQLPRIRDVLLYDWAWGAEAGRIAHGTNMRYARGASPDADEDGMPPPAGMGLPRPDPKRIKRAIELLGRVTADAPRLTRPPLLTMLGWLHWALGSGSTAGLHIDAALAIDPDYGLADLVDTMLSQGLLPEWSFERPELDGDERIVSLPVDDDSDR